MMAEGNCAFEEEPIMPLRDHFHAPVDDEVPWEALHGQWPAEIVTQLNRILPRNYQALPRIHWGPSVEIDVAAYEKAGMSQDSPLRQGGNGAAAWAPPQPTLVADVDLSAEYEYEIQVVDLRRRRRLVAAIELVSPANKDRPENRRAFVAKCAALLQEGVCVCIVDVVTTRHGNLYGELLDFVGSADPALTAEAPALYAAGCRSLIHGRTRRLETWFHPLALGQPLPTLPLWLAEDIAVALDLETSYEEACRSLRIE